MNSSMWSVATALVIFVAFALPAATVKAQGVGETRLTFAAAQSEKQKRAKSCRARYRDCMNLKQIPAFECQYIYRDCTNHIY